MNERIVDRIKSIDFNEVFMIDSESDMEYSYSEFFLYAFSIAQIIESENKSNTIIAIMENSPKLALLYFATIFTQKKIAVIDPQKGEKEIKDLTESIESSGYFVDSDFSLALSPRHHRLMIPLHYTQDNKDNIKEYLIDALHKREMASPYLVTFTSGTTGVTKGVEHSLNSLFLASLALDDKVKKRNGCFFHVMPMTYMAGILNSLFYPFIIGDKIVIGKRFSIISARSFWNTIKKYSVDLLWVSPSMLRMIDQIDRNNIGEEYCRHFNPTFLVGTAHLPNDLRKKFNERYGITVYSSYGLTETLFISVETEESIRKSDINCTGELLEGVEYRISPENELFVEVPWMFIRYTNENTEKYFYNKKYKTGDLAEIKDNYIYIIGRSKDLIIKGGMNISPSIVENLVDENPLIQENIVVGVTDKNGEERVCCLYVVKKDISDKQDFEQRLKNEVIKRLGKNYAIDYMVNLKEIPRNINGKVDRKKAVKLWENNYDD